MKQLLFQQKAAGQRTLPSHGTQSNRSEKQKRWMAPGVVLCANCDTARAGWPLCGVVLSGCCVYMYKCGSRTWTQHRRACEMGTSPSSVPSESCFTQDMAEWGKEVKPSGRHGADPGGEGKPSFFQSKK